MYFVDTEQFIEITCPPISELVTLKSGSVDGLGLVRYQFMSVTHVMDFLFTSDVGGGATDHPPRPQGIFGNGAKALALRGEVSNWMQRKYIV